MYGQSCMMCQSDTGDMYRDEGGWDFWPCVYVVNYSHKGKLVMKVYVWDSLGASRCQTYQMDTEVAAILFLPAHLYTHFVLSCKSLCIMYTLLITYTPTRSPAHPPDHLITHLITYTPTRSPTHPPDHLHTHLITCTPT